jgi:hypothetical protein
VTAAVATGGTALKPVVLAETALGAGDDNNDTVTSAEYIAQLALFNDALGSGAVVCPEDSGDTVAEALIDHANANSRIAILFGTEDATATAMKEKALTSNGRRLRACSTVLSVGFGSH